MQTFNLDMDFSLKHTLECGQFFRWQKIDDWYYIAWNDTLIKIKQRGNTLIYMCNPDKGDEFISRVFRFDDDLDAIIGTMINDPLLVVSIKKFKGLRLMRQEPFECLISFICSANSSIPIIKSKLNTISELYGEFVGLDGYSFFSFPKPRDLASADTEQLKDYKIGYHSKLIKGAASITVRESINLKRLINLSYADAKYELLKAYGGHGVGDKVADCVCLFALEKLEAFPVDVWIERIMRENYFGGKDVQREGISEFARDYFGRFAGYAQQYLYHYIRTAEKNSSRAPS